MKKSTILLITVLFMLIGYAAYNTTVNIYGLGKLSENISDFKVYLSNLKVNGAEISGINNAKDEFTISDINGDVTVDIVNASTEYDTEAYLECEGNNIWNYNYTGGEQTFTAPTADTYKFELWGAQGGSDTTLWQGANGGHTSGKLTLSANTKLYIYVGQNNNTANSIAFNGGSGTSGGHPGGGATDIRLVNGTWSNFDSLKSRIMVAGGGGASYYNTNGYAGGLIGGTASLYSNIGGTGGTQTSPGVANKEVDCAEAAKFGVGGTCGGGGGGYYGGAGSAYQFGGGGGGSSFISGYSGCNAISASSTETNIIHTNSSTHYSGYVFKETKMLSGNETMPSHDGTTSMVGNTGNGYAKVSQSKAIETSKKNIKAQETTNENISNTNYTSLTCKLKLNKLSRTEKAYTGQREWSYDYTGAEQSFTAPVSGTYKFELWGAQGGVYNQTAYGGYVSGELKLEENNKFYIYIGRYGRDSISNNYVFNYGYQNYTYTGGGSTDIRLINGSWDNLTSLASRIMVAGGGGGAGGLNPDDGGSPYGGSAGGLSGYQGGSCISGNVTEHQGSTGATQTSGHAFGYVPLLNTGENYNYVYNNSGGNGYWSGNFYDWVGSGGHSAVPGAGGGSSFISGHAGCVAITSQDNTTPRNDSNSSTCQDGTTDITCSYHYSNIIFKNTIMVDGNGYNWTTVKGKQTQMPSHDGTTTIVGNSGNGYARITLISTD